MIVVRKVLTLYSGGLHGVVSLGVFMSTSPSRHLVHIVRESIVRQKHATRTMVRHCAHILGPVRLRFVRPYGHCTSLVMPRNKDGGMTVSVLAVCVGGRLEN